VSTKTIRYYESIELLEPPERMPNGYREYGPEAEDRLRFIRDAQATGLSLAEIGSILELRSHGKSTCGHVIDLLEQHLLDLDSHMKRLRRARRYLTDLTERARGLDPAECTEPNRCQTIADMTGEKRDLRKATQQMYEVHGHRHV
jgi:DNA-binding transcriptional MerR regulator